MRQTLLTLLGLSDFVADSLFKQPELLTELLASGDLDQAERWPAYQHDLTALLAEVDDEEALKRILRQFRRSRMLVIAWRELLGHAAVEELYPPHQTGGCAYLRDPRLALRQAVRRAGHPDGWQRQPAATADPRHGQAGGGELNFSSDIDLIFTFPENGYTVGGRRELANQQFFIKLGQRIINALHQGTVDGQVFRVDMRLRPFGDAGPLAISFAAMEDYYQHHLPQLGALRHGQGAGAGASVRTRGGAGRDAAPLRVSPLYRLRRHRRPAPDEGDDRCRGAPQGAGGQHQAGAGGIREVEFIAQALQLIRGGSEPALRVRHLPEALAAIAQCGALEATHCDRLLTAYRFLRRVENILQEIGDQQTQTLPTEEGSPAARRRPRLCRLGRLHGPSGRRDGRRPSGVRRRGGEEKEAPAHLEQLWLDLWRTELDAAELEQLLIAQGWLSLPRSAVPCCVSRRSTSAVRWARRGASRWTG